MPLKDAAIITTPHCGKVVVAVKANAGRNPHVHAVASNLQRTFCGWREIQPWWHVVSEPIDCPSCLAQMGSRQ